MLADKVTLEEHILPAGFSGVEAPAWTPAFATSVAARLRDVEELRLPEMDRTGVAMQVLSVTAPGARDEKDPKRACLMAARINDALAEIVAAHPTRFAAFAELPCQAPERAGEELARCVEQLHLKGALVRGHSQGRYLDDAAYWPLWEAAEGLGVPIYLHPAPPVRPPAVLEGYRDLMGSSWGWGFETASHVLRLVVAGVFDRFPASMVIVGHMGEGLPYSAARLDNRWTINNHERRLEKLPSEYLRDNVMVTTSGVYSEPALRCALDVLGTSRVMFSVDYPFESLDEACHFIESVSVEEDVRVAVCRENARQWLRLGTG